MPNTIRLKKGLDINLKGKPEERVADPVRPSTFAVKPTDFEGIYMPKVLVKEGEVIKAGSPLFFDKNLNKVMYTSPVSGEVAMVERGAKRKLLSIRILADEQIEFEDLGKHSISDIMNLSADQCKDQMCKGGVWPFVVQRPYAIVANPDDAPKSIFVSTFDSSPLAPNKDFAFKGDEQAFQAGINVLAKLTTGKVHIGLDGRKEVSQLFSQTENVETHAVTGPHPAGNVGVQIHHIDPVHANDIVWTVSPFGVIAIGRLFLEGRYNTEHLVAVTGSEVAKPAYVKTFAGAPVKDLVAACGGLVNDHVRFISGNVLSGQAVSGDSYVGFYDRMITVIPEGDKPRFFLSEGWLAPVKDRFSVHRAFGLLSFMNGNKKEYVLDSSLNGEERAHVDTGTFENLVPMDILPEYLFKAIMAEDFDSMEALGIYEIAEEDIALCEFADVSKHQYQALVRKGINMLREG
jgi:Na+-transporting NADH:ubiquinone oxidoreductase subunit A